MAESYFCIAIRDEVKHVAYVKSLLAQGASLSHAQHIVPEIGASAAGGISAPIGAGVTTQSNEIPFVTDGPAPVIARAKNIAGTSAALGGVTTLSSEIPFVGNTPALGMLRPTKSPKSLKAFASSKHFSSARAADDWLNNEEDGKQFFAYATDVFIVAAIRQAED